MGQNWRRWAAGSAAVLAMATGPAVLIVVAGSSGTAAADVCASAGRRVTVSGCANLSDVMAPYVMPQDAYAPITPEASACIGWNGRWVNASGCT
ncbi:MAG TPA: hypothetical protein PKK01_11890 [Mycobacterium sp.]|nr:MAG: hypothetical protein E6Q56_03530 [Mycobacterium sp.]HOB49999.1 hypothetical protein [Mycobacterium sp.]HQE16447.1 hypothetical protein [Mycobacterium sp.]